MKETATEQSTDLVEIAALDDDPDFRAYIEDVLTLEGGYKVYPFAHPDDLYLHSEQRLPDIVLLDMNMGEFRGDKVLEQLFSRWPGLCVIIVTGYPSLEDMRATFKMKVFDYLGRELRDRTPTYRGLDKEVVSMGQNAAFPVNAGSTKVEVRVETLLQTVDVKVEGDKKPIKTAKSK